MSHQTWFQYCISYMHAGSQLASGGDGGEVMLWKPRDPSNLLDWKISTVLRFGVILLHGSKSEELVHGSVLKHRVCVMKGSAGIL